MEFSNLGSHNVLGPCDWHWAALTVKFCASKSLLVLRISWCSYSLPGILFLYFHVGHRLTSLLLSCHQPFQLGGHVFGKRAAWSFWLHSVSKAPCFLCLHPTDYFPHPIYCSKSLLSWWDCVYLPLKPYLSWMVCHCLPLKSFLFLPPLFSK